MLSERAPSRNLRGMPLLHNQRSDLIIASMTEKEIVLETIRALPDDCSLEEIAERVEFMAAVRKGLDQLDAGEGIPHEDVKRQLASWLTS
jgi:predicted transcriptional regulator